MALPPLTSISITCLAFYTPALLIAAYLAYTHGYTRNSGWIYLLVFALIRLLYASFQLASTYADPTNLSLIIGTQTLLSIGISALVLVMLGLLGRVLESIARQGGRTLVRARHVRFVQLFVGVGLILGIVGGAVQGNGVTVGADREEVGYTVASESKIGLGFVIAGFGLLVLAAGMTAVQVGRAEKGEKRLLGAVGLAVPFVLVRVVFSGMVVYGTDVDFMPFGGSVYYPGYLIGMALVMEMCAVVIFEGVGLTLRKRPEGERREGIWGAGGKMGFGLEGAARRRRRREERMERRRANWFGGWSSTLG